MTPHPQQITFERKEFLDFLQWVGVTGEIATTEDGKESFIFTLEVGASHSSQQVERDEVLDELYPQNTEITKNGDLYGGWEIDPKSLIRLKRHIESSPQYKEEPDMEVIETVILAVKHELKYGKSKLRSKGGE